MLWRLRTQILATLALALAGRPAAADDLATSLQRSNAPPRNTTLRLRALETSGREQTAAEVRLFRQEWQGLIDRFETDRPAEFDGDNFYAITLTEIDARLVAALIVIDIGSREAAREALAPIGETLARLRERAERR